MKENLNHYRRSATMKQFRALEAVIQNGTYTAAANQLNVTPPAVSIQMGLLEDMAGMPLVERVGDQFKATEAGNILVEAARSIGDVLSESAEALMHIKGAEGGTARVGIISTAKYFAPRALAAFSREHPGIDVRLSVGNRQETIAAMENHEIDFAIMGRPPENFEVESLAFGAHPHIIIAPPDHALASKSNIPIKLLAEERFLSREKGSGTRTLMSRLFTGVGIEPPLGMEIGSNETIKQAVIAGLGIALISAHTVAVELHDGRLSCLDILGMPLERNWFVVKRQEKKLLPATRALWDFLEANGKSFLPDPGLS
ncbi:MAG: LysR family transcriptional regulator [Alphaproteobacteria bacterium]|nr:LysR family transcriptional regulator [Alphaproteobacteria bacterium]